MILEHGFSNLLVSTETSRALDAEAQAEWGFNAYSLIEAAGRSCARIFVEAYPGLFDNPHVTVVAGPGNNGADAMVMLRYWILCGLVEAKSSSIVINRIPKKDDTGPRVELLKSMKKMNVRVLVWDGDIAEAAGRASDDMLAQSDIIIDGLAGTGNNGPLQGPVLEMVSAVNSHRKIKRSPLPTPHYPSSITKRPFVVSVDVPSGNSDHWEPGMPIVEADLTLTIEPQKYCVYTPAARPYAGAIIPVGGIFPRPIISRYKGAELLNWESVRDRVPKIRPNVYKNERGTLEIRAGSTGAAGAAMIAARGAQAAGAGLVRLVVDDEIYPILASTACGIIVTPVSGAESPDSNERFKPDAVLLGPGWGKSQDRAQVFEKFLALEKKGVPLVLDADAIELAGETIFSGNAILTPHPGEFSKFTGIEKNKLLSNPKDAILRYARERKAVIIFKGHVTTIAAPDGRIGVIDGMTPVLATGGSGDLLAGFCAALAARMAKQDGGFDGYTCAITASALIDASARSKSIETRFSDPVELADRAAGLAGEAWLGAERKSKNG